MADAMVVGGNFVAPGEDAYLLALEAFVASFRLDHERARDRAMTALRLADPEDVEAVVLASAVRALASAGMARTSSTASTSSVGRAGPPPRSRHQRKTIWPPTRLHPRGTSS